MRAIPWADFSDAHGKRLLVALSGGADSVALIRLLAERAEIDGFSLCAAHVHHGIRGAAADEDAAFCRELCRALNIPVEIVRVSVPEVAQRSGEGLETVARELRYRALHEARARFQADWIALAHHRADQAETVLMHLLRGCGAQGARGMSRLQGTLYRPLLNVPPKALRDYLTERGATWREDATNQIADNPRNILRLEIMPKLREIYPGAEAAVARYAQSVECDDRYIDMQAQAFCRDHMQTGAYGARLCAPEEAEEAVLRRAIQTLSPVVLEHDRLLEAVALCAQRHGKLQIAQNAFLERTPNALYALCARTAPHEAPLQLYGETALEGIGTLWGEECDIAPERQRQDRQALDADALAGCVLRTRRAGDRIRPLGCGAKLLSDYLTDRKIDRPLRDALPIVAKGESVYWVIGVGISEEAKITPSTKRAVRLSWRDASNANDRGGNQG